AADISPDELIKIDTCWSAAIGLALVDSMRGFDFQSRHLLLTLKTGEPHRIVRALALEAAVSSALGGRNERQTEKLIQMAMSLAERLEHNYSIGLVTGIAGFTAFQEGQWKRATEMCRRGESILRE